MYASETIQNCKNPTGHIDTLSFCIKRKLGKKIRAPDGIRTHDTP